MNLTTSLSVGKDNCFDYNVLEPFGTSYYGTGVTADYINPYFKVDYYLPKGNRFVMETSMYKGTKYNTSKGYTSDSYSRYTAFTYRYSINKRWYSEWYYSMKRKLYYGKINEYTASYAYFKYKMDKTANFTLKIRKDTDTERDGDFKNSMDMNFYKSLGKLSFKLSRYVEDTPGPSYFTENEVNITQKTSVRSSLKLRLLKSTTTKSSGAKSDYHITEFSYDMKF
jgi:hypothetical protein